MLLKENAKLKKEVASLRKKSPALAKDSHNQKRTYKKRVLLRYNEVHASYQLRYTSYHSDATDVRGTSSPQSLSQNVVRGGAVESRTEVLKGHNSGFRSPDCDDSLSLLAQASGSR